MKDLLKVLAVGLVYLFCFVFLPIVTGVARRFTEKYY